jgi:hypothetical protein
MILLSKIMWNEPRDNTNGAKLKAITALDARCTSFVLNNA